MGLRQDLQDDFERHGATMRNMAFWAVATYRIGNWANTLPGPLSKVGGKVYGVMSLFVEATTGILLNREARIGKEFHLVHAGNIKIHPNAIIGDRVGIMQDVTIGEQGFGRDGAPVIGNDVFIGAGAKILGPITIGDRARIAANSLVVTDVPADSTAIGVPAKIMRYTGRPASMPPPAPINGGEVLAPAKTADDREP
jgi:serine O-acetyltransferase